MAIADLEELVLRCRGESARLYVREAVAAYHGGAYRAAVVTTWIAVLFDLLDKLRELALAGDKNAKQKIETFDVIRAKGDAAYKEALEFERGLLACAAAEFELLTPVELEDLNRLRDDRNRCAHPSMQASDVPYQPPAELARLHIRSAVELLLSREPVQGKAAFARLQGEVESAYFPEQIQVARAQLEAGPFRRARRPLIRDFILAVSVSLLTEELNAKQRRQRVAALRAALEIHRGTGEDVLTRDLPRRLTAIEADRWWNVVVFMADVDGTWELLGSDIQARARRVVEEIQPTRPGGGVFATRKLTPVEQVEQRIAASKQEAAFLATLAAGLRLKELRQVVADRLPSLNVNHLAELVTLTQDGVARDALLPAVVERFCTSGGFVSTRTIAPAVIAFAPRLDLDKTREILRAFVSNIEVSMAGGVPDNVMPIVLNQTSSYADALQEDWMIVYKKLQEPYWKDEVGEQLRVQIRARFPGAAGLSTS